ncbi:hypothetical protein vseg_015676 [Gypsophila vaccaria]
MDAWLSEMEMTWNEDPIFNNLQEHEQYNQHNQEMDTLNEELASILGDDFTFTNFGAQNNNNNNISSLLLNCTPQSPTKLSCRPLSTAAADNNDYSLNSIEPGDHPKRNNNSSGDKKCVTSDENSGKICGRKRRRDPVQVHGHIMAERKRRELLTQRFIALSALIPGLKKVDKTTILEEAIKYLKQMHEKVKELEKAASKQVVMVVKSKQLNVENDNNRSIVVKNVNGSINYSSGGGDGRESDTLSKIQVKVRRNTIMLTICCVKRKGVLAKIYDEVERCGMIVLNTGVVDFENTKLDISILAQMEGAAGDEEQVKELLRSLDFVLRDACT